MPPLRPTLVPRPQLIEKLNQGLDGKLTLVAAPAGYGKTTLVADWLSQFILPSSQFQVSSCAWLSLDKYDNDPNRFWQYIFASLEAGLSGISSTNQNMLKAVPLPQPPMLLTNLINALSNLSHSIALVLDDYHVIDDRSIHQGLSYLIEHSPSQFHCILITRADPPFSRARLRSHGLLNEIRAADLCFSEEEATALLCDVMGLPISTSDVGSLNERTEGWITGLLLAAASLQGTKYPADFIGRFTGSQQYILEYLTDEVLLRQPESTQKFLLQTSILPKLCGPLCAAVTGRDDSKVLLEHLVQQNLFITPLDDSQQWYSYHQLLADTLGNRLRQLTPVEEIQLLHQRASSWSEENGEWEMAVNHSIQSNDWARTARLVARAYIPLTSQGRIATWQRWLAKIPAQHVQAQPELLIRQGWSAFLNGQVNQAEVLLKSARKLLLSAPESEESSALRGELSTYLATAAYFHGQPSEIIQAAEEALTFLPAEELTSRVRATIALGLGRGLAGDSRQALVLYQEAAAMARSSDHVFLLAHALETVADGQRHVGQLRASAATCQEIISLAAENQLAPLPFAGNGHIKLAAVYTETHQLALANDHLERGLELCQQGGIGYILFDAYCTYATLRRLAGDESGALSFLKKAEAILRENQFDILAVQLAAVYVQHWLEVGDVAEAAAWTERGFLAGGSVHPAEMPAVGQELHQIIQASVWLAQGHNDAALAAYDQVFDQARNAGRIPYVIVISLVRALALQAEGEIDSALETLRDVLSLAKTEGYIHVFVSFGREMKELLDQLPGDERDEYVNRLLNAFPSLSEPTSAAFAAGMVEPLSSRELQVLRLIAAGLSNKQIAEELTITLNTVKKHTSHIYSKLSVEGRTQAVAFAHEQKLL